VGVFATVVAAGCGGGDDQQSPESTVQPTTVAAPENVKTIDLDEAGATHAKLDGDWLVATDDAIWLSTGPGFLRLDPRTGQKTGEVGVPGDATCLGGASAFGALYAATCGTGEGLVRIDPRKLQATDSIRLPIPDIYNGEGTMAAGDGAVWVIIDGKGCAACVLAGFDPKTLSMTHEIDLDPGAVSVAAGDGFLWVTDGKRNRVLRVDPRTDEVVGETDVGGSPYYLAVDSNGVWVRNQIEGTVMQLDPETGEVMRTIDAEMTGAGGSVTVGDGSVWVRGTLTLLKQIDSETGEIVAEYGPDAGSGDALVDDGVLWVSGFEPGHGYGSGGSGIVYRLPLSQIH
jgi:glutamine cyclotransferase